jgi:hypothetical protein
VPWRLGLAPGGAAPARALAGLAVVVAVEAAVVAVAAVPLGALVVGLVVGAELGEHRRADQVGRVAGGQEHVALLHQRQVPVVTLVDPLRGSLVELVVLDQVDANAAVLRLVVAVVDLVAGVERRAVGRSRDDAVAAAELALNGVLGTEQDGLADGARQVGSEQGQEHQQDVLGACVQDDRTAGGAVRVELVVRHGVGPFEPDERGDKGIPPCRTSHPTPKGVLDISVSIQWIQMTTLQKNLNLSAWLPSLFHWRRHYLKGLNSAKLLT